MATEAELRRVAAKAAELTEELPSGVRGPIAAEVFRVLLAGELPTKASQPARPVETRSVQALERTLGEFLAELRSLSHPTRLVAIAAFRFQHDGVEGLTTDDFLAAYAEVRTPRPQNISLNLSRCIRRGWLVEGPAKDGQKTWRVTQRGLAMIDSIRLEVR